MSVDPNLPKLPVARVALTRHDALPAGTRFGEFEIIRVLGVGGFGIVYLAQDHSLERQVALKEYMPASLAARGAGAMITIRSGSFAETYAVGLRSFINEARLLARFDHPSLVKVYRFWEDNGTAYMVMPYLQGRTLRAARRAMVQAPDEAWIRGVLDPMLDALELLHREGVFHRDIAPDNILLPPDALPILLDFGAARRVISDRTQSLTAILKPAYAPIEQYAEMTAMRQGPWTDIYALGAVLHFLLFGVPPLPATVRAVQPELDVSEQIEQRIVAGVSPRFMGVVAWMLGVRPLERPQNVASLRAALNGEVPIPTSVRRDLTVPGDTPPRPAVPASAAPVDFAPTTLETPYEPTLRSEGSAYSAETRLGTAYQPTALLTRPAAAEPGGPRVPSRATVVAPAHPPGAAPMRSTPPGAPPPSYVPPPRAPQLSAPAAASLETRNPARRGWITAGVLAAVAVAAGVLWQFVGAINGPRPIAPPLAAASVAASAVPAAPVLPAGTYTGPTVAQIASVPQWGASARPSVAVVPAPKTVATPADPASTASTANPVRPKRAPARASEPAHDVSSAAPAGVRRLRAAAVHAAPLVPPARALPVAAGPANAREACGDRHFIALAMCIDRECERPRFRKTAECARVLAVKQRRAER